MLSSPARNHRLDSDLPAQGLNEKPVTGSAALFYSLPHSMIAVICLFAYIPTLFHFYLTVSVLSSPVQNDSKEHMLSPPDSSEPSHGARGAGEWGVT